MAILVVNCGSSSVKVALVEPAARRTLAEGSVDRIGEPEPGRRYLRLEEGAAREESAVTKDHRQALEWLSGELGRLAPEAVGHRVVHGGASSRPVLIDDAAVADLEALSPLAPLHNPAGLAGIAAARILYPDCPHYAVFDTAFHATLPEHAYRYAVPERLFREHGVRRYGFHGLSHCWVAEEAARLLGRDDLRLVSLHLGSGCSAAAIAGGASVETSMGMTPLEGLVMGTRPGDLDPAVPLLLPREDAEHILNRECGLEALSGGMSDMRDILAAMAAEPRARLAFEAFCHRAQKYVGAYAAVLGGVDALAFTAGIGENSAEVRSRICRGLAFMGVQLDEELNRQAASGTRDIGRQDARARVLVVPADEEGVIARTVAGLLGPGRSGVG